jgi:dTDP-4-amino-4,6-dideoxygalactose transaminase
VTEDIFKRIITLPLFPRMGLDKMEYIVETIKAYKK